MIMLLNKFGTLSISALEPAGVLASGDDVAASIRQFFGANFARVLNDLKLRGIRHKDVAEVMGVPSTRISNYKDGMIPEPERLDRFCNAYNVQPEDLFVDPTRAAVSRGGAAPLEADLVEAIKRFASAVGYEIVKRKTH